MMDISKQTKIVCTIGPASEEVDTLVEMVKAGMNVCRLNFSHGTHAEHATLIKRIHKVRELTGEPLTILQDLQGPKIRVGALPEEGIMLVKGKEVVFTTGKHAPPKKIGVSYSELHKDVKPGQKLLLDDGMLAVTVREIKGKDIYCEITEGGLLTSHKGINLPETDTRISSITEKDRADIAFGIEQSVDWIALSFVQGPEDIIELKSLLGDASIKVMAKIEKPKAIERFDEILEVVDGIMVARGDLGIEMTSTKVPVMQKNIVQACLKRGVPVVVATQMLNSMIEHTQATRAEVSDVANAVVDHADATMLSAESAAGRHPVLSVQTMADTIRETEASPFDDLPIQFDLKHLNQTTIANQLARSTQLKAVLIASMDGASVHLVSRYRPEVPIFVAVPSQKLMHQFNMYWGVRPFYFENAKNEVALIDQALNRLTKEALIQKNDPILVVAGKVLGESGQVQLVELRGA